MPTHDLLLTRIRGEFREMPGLRLTFEQACRLWHLDPTNCRAVLDRLAAEGFLHVAEDGAYSAAVATRGPLAKATTESSTRSKKRTPRSA
jgi:hypothetical protein